jgi:O-antigen ligase
LRWVAGTLAVATLLSYIAGLLRGLSTLESNAQDFALIATCEFLGVMLVAADGLPNWRRLNGVLRVWVGCASIMAVIGLAQSALKLDLTRYLVVPGLHLNADPLGFEGRGTAGLARVASTATHYIEFATVAAMAVPFAIHFARFADTRRQRQMFAAAAALTAAAVPVSISRTGVVALAAALVVMVPIWSWRFRYSMLVAATGLFIVLIAARPGLLGTLRVLFTQSTDDPSIQGRTDDYAAVARWFAERPWLGRGPHTLIPVLYRILDNQWLYTLVTGGLIGVAALLALHITCVSLAAIALRRSTRPADRHLCAALISAQLVAVVVGLTFDSLAFTTFSTTLALLAGICGAVWRFTHPTRAVRTSTVRAIEE